MICTQNPTRGEEWRRGWHPERIPDKDTDDTVLIVGAGPAGLEAACALGQRGYQVTLAEATAELGGRVARECRLPGLNAWGRVRDYRMTQLARMPNVELYRESRMRADDVREVGTSLVAVATGATWRRDGVGRWHSFPMPIGEWARVCTPDEILSGAIPATPVVIYDDDHFYTGGALAEKLRLDGLDVTLVTPAPEVSTWTTHTLEQFRIQKRLLELGVEIVTSAYVAAVGNGTVDIACAFTDRTSTRECGSVLMVTARTVNDGLYLDLIDDPGALEAAGINRVVRIGDCYGPGTIAAAVYAGHKFARDLGAPITDEVPFKRENVELSPDYRDAFGAVSIAHAEPVPG